MNRTKMNDLKTILDQLEDNRLDYVLARSKTKSDADGIRNSGVGKTTFYGWDKEERDKLNELAQKLKRETAIRALMLLQDAVEEAATVKIQGMKSRNEHIKQNAASEILDRQLGKPTQRTEHTGDGGGEIGITVRLASDDEL